MAVPKPRKEGQRGGMNHSGSQARSARRGGDPGNYSGPPKLPCLPALLLFLTVPGAFFGMIYYHFA